MLSVSLWKLRNKGFFSSLHHYESIHSRHATGHRHDLHWSQTSHDLKLTATERHLYIFSSYNFLVTQTIREQTLLEYFHLHPYEFSNIKSTMMAA